jgi:thymidine kinase
MNNPEFVIFTGPMFGGKTTRMISLLERARYQNKRIILFKPQKDNRFSEDKVVAHNGLVWESINIRKGRDINKELENNVCDIIAVDEAFMIKGIGDTLISLFKKGYSVYVSSIQLSAKLKPFKEIQKIMPWATKIEICPAVCPISGTDAFYTRSYKATSHIQVGGMEIYHPVSYHYNPEFKK